MSEEYDFIKSNIEEINQKIQRAAEKSGRNAEEINLIGVSKTVDVSRMQEALKAGIKNFGENRVQEFCEKFDIITEGCKWHLIGHLQTNKVKYIIDKVDLIHSVDSLELLQEINKRAEKNERTVEVLVQVNVSGEQTKYGIKPERVLDFIKTAAAFKNVKVKGLMTIAPYTEKTEEIRFVFANLRKIFIDIKRENVDNIDIVYLSMGMSNDFEIAIEEGSNMVRIGSAIFGKRQY